MEVDRVSDIMNYFGYSFISTYSLLAIVVFLTIISFKNRYLIKISIPIILVSLISMLSTLIFIGVLADNQAPNYLFWGHQVFVIILIIFALLVLQFVRLLINSKKK